MIADPRLIDARSVLYGKEVRFTVDELREKQVLCLTPAALAVLVLDHLFRQQSAQAGIDRHFLRGQSADEWEIGRFRGVSRS